MKFWNTIWYWFHHLIGKKLKSTEEPSKSDWQYVKGSPGAESPYVLMPGPQNITLDKTFPPISAQGISDVWKLTDPEFVEKVKKIVDSVDSKKIKAIMDMVEQGEDGYIDIKINLKFKREVE